MKLVLAAKSLPLKDINLLMKYLLQIITSKVFLCVFILGIILSLIPLPKECNRIQNYEGCIEIDSLSKIIGIKPSFLIAKYAIRFN